MPIHEKIKMEYKEMLRIVGPPYVSADFAISNPLRLHEMGKKNPITTKSSPILLIMRKLMLFICILLFV
jgi:hypothetical protein